MRRSRSSTPQPDHRARRDVAAARAAAGRRDRFCSSPKTSRRTSRLLRPQDSGGFGFDALWNDDFHHAAVVALTGRREAYFTDYPGTPQEFVSLAKWGFLYQGQRYSWQHERRGTPTLGFAPSRFVTFLENHDQIANAPSGRGERLHQRASPGLYRAMTALWLLSPGTPMFFQGQEFARVVAVPVLRRSRRRARRGRASGPRRVHEPVPQRRDPRSSSTRCRIPPTTTRSAGANCVTTSAQRRTAAVALHRDLLRLRREDPVFGEPRGGQFDGAVLSDRAFVLRWFAERSARGRIAESRRRRSPAGRQSRRRPVAVDPAPEPLLAPPAGSGVGHPLVERGSGVRRRRNGAARDRRRLADSRPGRGRCWLAALDCHDTIPSGVCHCPSADPASYSRASGSSPTASADMPPGTISGIVTRRYHGLLVAALPAPVGRMVMLSHVDAQIRLPSGRILALAPEPPRPLDSDAPADAARDVARRVPAGARPADLALRGRRFRHREARADAASPEHRAPDVPAAVEGRRRSGSSCGRSCTFATTRAR